MVRSARADYNLQNKTKTELYIRVFNDSKLAQDIEAFNDVLMSSAYAKNVTVTESGEKIPEGCAIGKKDTLYKHPYAMSSEKGNFRIKRCNQLGRFRGHILNTKQSNLKFGKFLFQK